MTNEEIKLKIRAIYPEFTDELLELLREYFTSKSYDKYLEEFKKNKEIKKKISSLCFNQ